MRAGGIAWGTGDAAGTRAYSCVGMLPGPTISPMAVVIASDLGKDMAGEPLLRGVSFKLSAVTA